MRFYGLKITLANYCGYKCKYCYVNTDNTDIISEDILYRTLRYYLHQIPHKKNIFFLGGEVLLNFPILEKALVFCKEQNSLFQKDLSLFLTTSGLGATAEKIRTLREYNVSIGISIDGNEATHGKNRLDKKGNNTHANTLVAIEKFNQYFDDKNLGYTITVDENTADSLFDSFCYLSNLDRVHRNVSIGCVSTKIWSIEKETILHSEVEKIMNHIYTQIEVGQLYYYNSLAIIIRQKINLLPIGDNNNYELHVFPDGEVSGNLFHQSKNGDVKNGEISKDPLTKKTELLDVYATLIIEQSKTKEVYRKYISSLQDKAILW